ncbi:CAP domain-containing protein [Telluria aromaticivorans]|uniref:CAP domain-containing protein n=1 Tax=Telluria aromaticivorans TaxID=2725995 RepID=UPI001E561287|nr:CAP domain-containing protein [Telluria aromaticivorans]
MHPPIPTLAALSFALRPGALPLLLALAVCWPGQAAAAPSPADGAEGLTTLINAYRAAPGACNGRAVASVDALTAHPALARVRIGPATFIETALERAGYAADHAETISVTGPQNAVDAMTVLQEKYCKTLLNPRFSAVGSYRDGNAWTVLLARPSPPLPSATYPDWRDAGQEILARVNAARASGRTCGSQAYPPAAPVRWDAELGQAALAHSQDMAARRYFSHKAKDGSTAAERARRAGYHWQRVGENIAFGQRSPEEAMAGWLESPGHCANIMNPGFTEMGAAYGMASEHRAGIIYWTQVFGRPG